MFIRTMGDIAQLVRERRKQMGLSQAELALKAGVSRQWIVDLERGKPTAEISLVLRTLAATGLQLRAYDPRQLSVISQTDRDVLGAVQEVLDDHRPAGPQRTLVTRPPRRAKSGTKPVDE